MEQNLPRRSPEAGHFKTASGTQGGPTSHSFGRSAGPWTDAAAALAAAPYVASAVDSSSRAHRLAGFAKAHAKPRRRF